MREEAKAYFVENKYEFVEKLFLIFSILPSKSEKSNLITTTKRTHHQYNAHLNNYLATKNILFFSDSIHKNLSMKNLTQS